MKRYELSSGTSHKFWAIERKGSDVTVQWGRIGTDGQARTKTFASSERAKAEADKLVAEKTRKGYRPAGKTASRAASKKKATKKATVAPEPGAVAAATSRVLPLLKKFPKELRPNKAAIQAAALRSAALVHRKSSSAEIGGVCVFGGDLVIDGSFDVGCVCIVLGDLTVRDLIWASKLQTYLVVGGTIRARGLVCKGHIRAAGDIEAEVIFVETSTQLAAKRIATDLLIMEWATDEVEGAVRAKAKVGLTYPSPKGLEKLKRMLDPRAFATVDGEECLFDYSRLENALRKRKAWRPDEFVAEKTRKGYLRADKSAKKTKLKPPSKNERKPTRSATHIGRIFSGSAHVRINVIDGEHALRWPGWSEDDDREAVELRRLRSEERGVQVGAANSGIAEVFRTEEGVRLLDLFPHGDDSRSAAVRAAMAKVVMSAPAKRSKDAGLVRIESGCAVLMSIHASGDAISEADVRKAARGKPVFEHPEGGATVGLIPVEPGVYRIWVDELGELTDAHGLYETRIRIERDPEGPKKQHARARTSRSLTTSSAPDDSSSTRAAAPTLRGVASHAYSMWSLLDRADASSFSDDDAIEIGIRRGRAKLGFALGSLQTPLVAAHVGTSNQVMLWRVPEGLALVEWVAKPRSSPKPDALERVLRDVVANAPKRPKVLGTLHVHSGGVVAFNSETDIRAASFNTLPRKGARAVGRGAARGFFATLGNGTYVIESDVVGGSSKGVATTVGTVRRRVRLVRKQR